ncbi:N-6 DNA methylase [Heliobacillus mobilis]|uniref:site-specific DNA-methyltransferase (adenine-specific) n=1 Tax=Heliobacterium mobile TaxID=28064 RepID=A0A6I3SNN2_HELMO|nr:N-6 DNA methylase [Heliobacterium mobile]MTV49867.1 N-6 DNA methylase [Heliobacterium mobile]
MFEFEDVLQITQEIRESGKKAKTEEDVRLGTESILRRHLPNFGVAYDPAYEVTISNGRIDALFHHLVIEYKEPGKLDSVKAYTTAVSQALEYISNLSKKNHEEKSNYVAVIMDGKNIGFARFNSNDERVIIDRQPINTHNVRLFLKYVSALNYKALNSKNLLIDFGPNGDITKTIVSALWNSFCKCSDVRTTMFFTEWRRLFGQVSGFGSNSGPEQTIGAVAKGFGLDIGTQYSQFIFVLHTYYSMLIKLIALFVLENVRGGNTAKKLYLAPSIEEKKNILSEIENGSAFKRLGVTNFLEGDFFSWYINEWNQELAYAVINIQEQLYDYDPSVQSLMPEAVKDLLKTLYQRLVPKQIRHDLGEYYTPDWLAQYVLRKSGFKIKDRVLDPTCGSGTFLVLAIQHKIQGMMELPKEEILKHILESVYGYDLNPLAVIASRTNYLLALGDLLEYADYDIEIPVYLTDAIMSPQKEASGYTYRLETNEGPIELVIPEDIVQKGKLGSVLVEVEKAVIETSEGVIPESQAKQNLEVVLSEWGLCNCTDEITRLYSDILELEKKKWNRIWCRVLKNHFATVTLNDFDVLIGNPPWLRWSSLPETYRNSIKGFCQQYNLFSKDVFVGGIEADISTLVLYLTAEKWLKNRGNLAYLITRSVFKTESSEGFRKFQIPRNGTFFRVLQVEDFTNIKPFEGASNKPSLILLKKGQQPTTFPVPWIVWEKIDKKNIGNDFTLKSAMSGTNRKKYEAYPINSDGGPWLTVPQASLEHCVKLIRTKEEEYHYPARKGICTDRNGIYFGNILGIRGKKYVIFENNVSLGRQTLPTIKTLLEKELVYPIARGREVSAFQWTFQGNFGIVPQEGMDGYPEDVMRAKYGKALDFFKSFEFQGVKELSVRGSYRRYHAPRKAPYYSVWNVGAYSFAPHKVVWSEISGRFEACVISSLKSPYWDNPRVIVPDHKLYFVPFECEDEAHYLCAFLNAPQVEDFVLGYAEKTQIGAHVTEYLHVPIFSDSDLRHMEMVQISKEAHEGSISAEQAREKMKEILPKL